MHFYAVLAVYQRLTTTVLLIQLSLQIKTFYVSYNICFFITPQHSKALSIFDGKRHLNESNNVETYTNNSAKNRFKFQYQRE